MLENIFTVLNLVCSGLSLILTILMLLSYRKPKRFRPGALLFSILFAVVTLPVFILISGARLNWIVGVVLFFLGALFGAVRAMTIKLYYQQDEVIGRNSMLSLAGWGGSLAFSMLMNVFDSAFLASLGLSPLVLATGTQIALNAVLLLRRLVMRPPQRVTV